MTGKRENHQLISFCYYAAKKFLSCFRRSLRNDKNEICFFRGIRTDLIKALWCVTKPWNGESRDVDSGLSSTTQLCHLVGPVT